MKESQYWQGKEFKAETFGKNVQYFCGRKGMSFTELSRAFGGSDATISTLVRTGGTPSVQTVIGVARVFGISLEDLLFEDFEELEKELEEEEAKVERLKARLRRE